MRKEQDAFRCIVVDAEIKTIWPELFISPFGVVKMATATHTSREEYSTTSLSRRGFGQLTHECGRHPNGIVCAVLKRCARCEPVQRRHHLYERIRHRNLRSRSIAVLAPHIRVLPFRARAHQPFSPRLDKRVRYQVSEDSSMRICGQDMGSPVARQPRSGTSDSYSFPF